jgi:glycosyltransferase involved in cell wall biosynthesis
VTAPARPHGPLVTVIVPTHRHASTVDLACQSVLDQSVRSLELVVIGDGATYEVREAVRPLLRDTRVRFIEHPKTSSRGELIRHQVLTLATSSYVCYLGDDDVMLPDHLARTVERLETVDFTHPLPVFVDRRGHLRAHATDLADPRCRLWHDHPSRNAVSLTGVGHRLDAYRQLAHGWREAPPGRWSDHYMWQQWFAHPGFRYATGERLTVLKFDASVRGDMDPAERRAEVMAWLQRSREPGFDAELAARAAAAGWRAAVHLRLAVDSQADRHARQLAARDEEWRSAERRADAEAAVLRSQLGAIKASRTWRARNQLVEMPLLRRLSRR